MEEVKFVTKVSKTGKKLYVVVPKQYHEQFKRGDVVVVVLKKVLSQ